MAVNWLTKLHIERVPRAKNLEVTCRWFSGHKVGFAMFVACEAFSSHFSDPMPRSLNFASHKTLNESCTGRWEGRLRVAGKLRNTKENERVAKNTYLSVLHALSLRVDD